MSSALFSFRPLVPALGTAILGAGLTFGAGASAQTGLDFVSVYPDSNFIVQSAKRFAEEVGKATNGEVVINVHSSGDLGFRGPDLLRAVQNGLVAMADMDLNEQVGEAPILALQNQPFLIRDFEELGVFTEHFRPLVEEVAKEHDQKVLYIIPWPSQYLYTKVPVESVEDLAGIKVRTVDAVTTELFNRLGMSSVQLPWSEAVPALAAGVVDAAATSSTSGVDGKFWEFMKYMYPTNHVWNSNIASVNLDAWESLSPDQRAAIEEVAGRLEPEFWEVSRSEDEENLAILSDNGITIGEVSPEMRADMQRRTASITEGFIEENGDEAAAIVDAYRAELSQ